MLLNGFFDQMQIYFKVLTFKSFWGVKHKKPLREN